MRIRELTLTTMLALGIAAAGPASAVAVPLPSATTEGTSEVTSDTATLSGTVTPGGGEVAGDTRWCFEYGAADTPGYNQGFAPSIAGDAGNGTGSVPVSLHLNDLVPGGTYRYRLVAVDALGEGHSSTACGTEGGQEADGSEGLFTTPSALPPPLAVTGTASNLSQDTATISGTVNPYGSPTTYEFQVGLDTGYGVQVFGSAGQGSEPQPLSLTLQYLQPGTTYHYRLLAINPGGTSYGADETLTTSVFPTAVLSAPATAPLISNPVIAFPTDTTKVLASKSKAPPEKAGKKKAKKRARKAKKASRVGRRSRVSTTKWSRR